MLDMRSCVDLGVQEFKIKIRVGKLKLRLFLIMFFRRRRDHNSIYFDKKDVIVFYLLHF